MEKDIESPSVYNAEFTMSQKKALLLVLLLGIAGCGGRRGPRPEVEVVTVEQQALAEIEAAPLDFVVPLERDTRAWERARTFFELYAAPQSGKTLASPEDLRISNSGDPLAKYVYYVERMPHRQGVRYTVRCQANAPGADSYLADRNARNLARFIRDGTLERSLLEQ